MVFQKISINYGYENKIDPLIISHPANCKLMRQQENASKNKKSSISLKQLISDIKIWNKKYGVIV